MLHAIVLLNVLRAMGWMHAGWLDITSGVHQEGDACVVGAERVRSDLCARERQAPERALVRLQERRDPVVRGGHARRVCV